MRIEIEIPDEYLDRERKDLLKTKFKIENDEELSSKITLIAQTATKDYLDMFSGQALPTQAKEILIDRLDRIISGVFSSNIPDEFHLSSLMQTSPSDCKRLLRDLRHRHAEEYEPRVRRKIQDILSRAELVREKYELAITSKTILSEIKSTVENNRPNLPPIRKKPNTGKIYQIKEDTMDYLREHYAVPL